MLKNKTTVNNQLWSPNLRVRVGEGVRHLDRDWTNVTGQNSEPAYGNIDWKVSSPKEESDGSKPTILVNDNLFFLNKNPLNLLATTLEFNDIASSGFWDENEFWVAARYLGGDKDVKTNWQRLSYIEEIPTI